MQKAKGVCPATQKGDLQYILRASLIFLFSSSTVTFFCFHVEKMEVCLMNWGGKR